MHRKLWYKTHQNFNVSYGWTSPNRAQFLGWHTVPSRYLENFNKHMTFVWRVKEINDSRTGRRALAHAQVERTWGAGRPQDWHSMPNSTGQWPGWSRPLFSQWHCSQPSAWTDLSPGEPGVVCVWGSVYSSCGPWILLCENLVHWMPP